MGGYASFPICIAASILRIKFIIYENNLIIGRANKKLLPFAEKILVSNKKLEGISSKYNSKCLTLDKMSLFQILPIIANCDVAVCNDSSFSHLSAAIGIPTIVLMADTPLLYGSYSSKMFPIIPDGEVTVKHDTLGKEKIDPQKIFYKFNELIN